MFLAFMVNSTGAYIIYARKSINLFSSVSVLDVSDDGSLKSFYEVSSSLLDKPLFALVTL